MTTFLLDPRRGSASFRRRRSSTAGIGAERTCYSFSRSEFFRSEGEPIMDGSQLFGGFFRRSPKKVGWFIRVEESPVHEMEIER